MSDLTYVYSKSALWTMDSVRIAGLNAFTPPAITATIGNKKQTWSDMAVPVDTGLEPIQCEFKTDADPDVMIMFGFMPGQRARVQARRTYRDNNGSLHVFVDELEGIVGTLTPDENGTDSKEGVGLSVTMNLSYYKLTIDDKVIFEIDPQNTNRTINGVNVLQDEKDALLM